MLKLGSLFSGSGGFELGGLLAGALPVWNSEIEPFPIRVTTKRMPFVKHLGNINDIHGDKIDPVDIVTFGSPCTDMSIAGKRAGLDGAQSSLFYQAIRIVKEMRWKTNGKYPRFIVWENVTGAFSSNQGRDFQAVLTEIVRIKDEEAPPVPVPEKGGWPYADVLVGEGWSLAYRTLDAQYWGVPQRRKRIYLVADFAGTGAGEILFESESVSGYPAAGRGSGQGFAGCFETCADAAGGKLSAGFCPELSAKAQGIGFEQEKAPTLRAGAVPAAVYENHSQDTRYRGPLAVAPTVSQTYGAGGNNQPFVVDTPKLLKIRCGHTGSGGRGPLIQENLSATLSCNNDQTLFEPEKQKVYGISSDQSKAMLSGNPQAGIYEAATSRTLDQAGGNPGCNQGGMAIVEKRDAPVYAMTTGEYTQVEKEKSPTLAARDYKDPITVNQPMYAVRRLTPLECGRLQGFPDGWCQELGIVDPSEDEMAFWREVFETHRKIMGTAKKPKTNRQILKWLLNPHTDSAEYKMWGNGVALPCVFFVLSGIVDFAGKDEAKSTENPCYI